jgi:hypothetical protein
MGESMLSSGADYGLILSQLTCHASIHIGEAFVTAQRVRALAA